MDIVATNSPNISSDQVKVSPTLTTSDHYLVAFAIQGSLGIAEAKFSQRVMRKLRSVDISELTFRTDIIAALHNVHYASLNSAAMCMDTKLKEYWMQTRHLFSSSQERASPLHG